MGSSDERSRNAIDASVDGLVWVRRRNGSWWPGRIMALDEVPVSSLVKPKSGTPIQLLGRDAAKVDWYNLKRSKKVKAFRCGDLDACIENAKTGAAKSAKKTVKYARNREGAILLALEIESKYLGEEPPDTGTKKQNSHNEKACGKPGFSKDHKNTTGDARDSEGESDSAPELLQSGISFEEPNYTKRRRTPNDSEEDGTEGMKRMRGLEDLGVGIGSKPKIVFEPVKLQCVLPSDVKPNSYSSKGIAISATKVYVSSLKRKRSQASNHNESLKRKHRRRPLTKVLESTAVVSAPITFDQFGLTDGSPNREFSESKLPGLESHELRKSLSAAVNNNTDCTGVPYENDNSLNAFENVCEASHNEAKDGEIPSSPVLAETDSCGMLFDVPVVEEENNCAGFSSAFTCYSPGRALSVRIGRPSDMVENAEAIIETEVLDESLYAPISAAHVSGNFRGNEKSGSEWQSKGKRNSRHMSRKQDRRQHTETDVPGNDFPQGTDHKPNSSVSSSLRFGMQDFTESSSLYDVMIEVNTDDSPKNVPMVSLMSKINGKPVIGHPLTVEVLEDGFYDHLFNSNDYNPIVETVIPAPKKRQKKPKARKSHLPPLKSSRLKKSRKRVSSSKKTRRLSSLTGAKPSERKKKLTSVKQEKAVVACIPLKLVFSRINEAMNGSSRQAPSRSLPSAASS